MITRSDIQVRWNQVWWIKVHIQFQRNTLPKKPLRIKQANTLAPAIATEAVMQAKDLIVEALSIM